MVLREDEFWTIELLEFYVLNNYPNVKLMYFVRSQDGSTIALVKTRDGQGPPLDGEHVMMLLEGAHESRGGYHGKASFSIKEHVPPKDWTAIDWEYLPAIRERAMHRDEDAVSWNDLEILKVIHDGSCGPRAIAACLGMPAKCWRDIFRRLVSEGPHFDGFILDNFEGDALPPQFWFTSECSE